MHVHKTIAFSIYRAKSSNGCYAGYPPDHEDTIKLFIKKLILLGGIVINTSSNTTNKIQDYFLIKNPFETIELK